MVEGLWTVQFHGPQGTGGGVVVLVGTRVLGGDSGFAYEGTFEFKDNTLKARVVVKNFDASVPNVLGVSSPFNLVIDGKLQGDVISGFAALANAPNSKMTVRLTRTASLK
jgi:hypothetical protein